MKYKLEETKQYSKWVKKVGRRVRILIAVRLTRAQNGNFGDHKSVGGGVSEMRLHSGKGNRIYYTIREGTIILLLMGGDKSNQQDNIETAKKLARKLKS
jgi:putative addiction module killer protein